MMPDLLKWLEAHQALSSWVQAAGAIIAIASGFAVAAWQQRKSQAISNEQRQSEGVALAILIRDEIATLGAKFGALFNADVEDTSGPGIGDYSLSTPRNLSNYADKMYLIKGAGHSVLRLIATLSSNRAMLSNMQEGVSTGDLDYNVALSNCRSIAERGMKTARAALTNVDEYIAKHSA